MVGPTAQERETFFFDEDVSIDGGGIQVDGLVFLLELALRFYVDATFWLENVPIASAAICNLISSFLCNKVSFAHTETPLPPMLKRCYLTQL